MAPSTFFAPAERADWQQLNTDNVLLWENKVIKGILDAMPNWLLVLNPQRQIVACNHALLHYLGLERDEKIIGQRPGELLNCVNACRSEGGCGTAEFCRYCGAVQAIISSMGSSQQVVRECRILANTPNGIRAYDFRVTASPMELDKHVFTFFTLVDIADEKRRLALEGIFFHDVLNTAGMLKNTLDMAVRTDDEDFKKEMLATLPATTERLIGEIKSQRELIKAENNELKLNVEALPSHMILAQLRDRFLCTEAAANRGIVVEEPQPQVILNTDFVVINRILGNLLKNALEAIEPGQTVTMGSELNRNDDIVFWVKNPGVMDKPVAAQVFQRSFSTKGQGRGLGTYSVKLLTEKYLRGTAEFISTEQTQTIFYVALPLQALPASQS